jgi:hypothetical protein
VVRHLPEILLLVLLIRLWQITAEQIGPLWTNVLTLTIAVGLVWWRRSRWWLIGVLGCTLIRARLRAAFTELRLSRRSGRLPVTLPLVPTAVGERVWLCCPIGVALRTSPMRLIGCVPSASPARSASPATAGFPRWWSSR